VAEPKPAGSPLWGRLFQAVSELGVGVSLLTALLLYFGWVRAGAQAREMGLDANLFGYTTQDYLLLSIGSLYVQLLWIAVAVLGGVWLDRRIRERVDARVRRSGSATVARWARRGTWFFVGLAVAARILGGAVPEQEAWVVPFVMALCVLGAAWAAGLRRRVVARGEPLAAPDRQLLRGFALVSVVALLVFWGTSAVAEAMGRAMAHDLEDELETMPRTVVYSEKPLHIGLPGVGLEELGPPDDPLYRYDGLRLLTLRGGRYFLLPEHWTVAGSSVLVLPDDSSVRLEYSR
jgi:hypothetical protein